MNSVITQLRITQAGDGVVFVQPLLRLGSGLHVPLQEWSLQAAGNLLGQLGFTGARFALDQDGAAQCDCRVNCGGEVFGGNIPVGAGESLV